MTEDSENGPGISNAYREQTFKVDLRPCESCSDLAFRKFYVGGRWICARCVSPQACATCGVATEARIERYAVANAEDDTYRLAQTLLFICADGHVTVGPTQEGPAAVACVVFRTEFRGDRKTPKPLEEKDLDSDEAPKRVPSIVEAIRRVLVDHPEGRHVRDITEDVQRLREQVPTSRPVVNSALQHMKGSGIVAHLGGPRSGVYVLSSTEAKTTQ